MPSDSVDLLNSIFHYNHELHKVLFKNVVKTEFSIAADSYAYKAYSFSNFNIDLDSPKYIIPFVHEQSSEGLSEQSFESSSTALRPEETPSEFEPMANNV